MTKIIGRPQGYALSVPLKLVIREEIPYRSPEVGISAGTYEATWKNGRWEAYGAELNVSMPRFEQPDAMALSNVTVFISRTDTGQQVAKYPYKPGEWAETAPGVLDLQVPAYERRWQTTQSMLKVIDNANAAAQDVTSAVTDLTSQKQTLATVIDQQVERVDGKLADIASSTTLMQQAAGVGRVATEADLAGKPAGAYELTSTNERLMWDGNKITPGSRGPMLATDDAVANVIAATPDAITTTNADALLNSVNQGKTVQAVQKRVLQLTQSHTLNTASATAQLSGSVLRWSTPQTVGIQLKNLTTPKSDTYYVENDVLSNVRLEMLDAQGHPATTGTVIYAGSDTPPETSGFNAGGAFRNSWGLHTYGGSIGVQYGHGNWQTTDHRLIVERFNDIGIYIPAGLHQFGEVNSIDGGAVFGGLKPDAVAIQMDGGEFRFHDFSIDYIRCMTVTRNEARAYYSYCYWELDSHFASLNATKASFGKALNKLETGARVVLDHPEIVAMPEGNNVFPADMYYWSVDNGVLALESPEFVNVQGSYTADSWVGTTSPYAQVTLTGRPRFLGNAYTPVCRSKLNRITYPGWELKQADGKRIVDNKQWTVDGSGGTFDLDTAQKHTGEASAKLSGASGAVYLTLSVPINPGQAWLFDAFIKLDGVAEGLKIVQWVEDSRGNWVTATATAVGIEQVVLKGTQDWTRLGIRQDAMNALSNCIAPAGAAILKIQLSIPSGAGTAWIDDLTLEIY